MQDNVRIGKESLTKKISYHEQHPKKYSTIQSLQKEPTRKNIKLQYPAKHPQVSLNQHKNYPERKLKSLSKHERRQTEVRRWGEGSQPQLSTIDGLLKRNAHHLSKFSLSKQRQGQACKQKYKRSQQIRSVIETKKMSSLNKMERKHTDATVSMTNFYNSISESYQPVSKNKLDLKEPQLDTIINPSDNYEQEPTLEDVLISAVHLLYAYFGKKEEKTSTANTSYLKKKRQNSLTELQVVEQKLRSIMQETGEMSLRTLVVFGIVKYQENKYNDSIMYLTKVLEATDGNLMLIDLPANSKEQIKSQLENTQNKTKSFQLNLHAYIALAESFRVTNNYLCSINALLKWQFYFIPAHKNQQPHLSLKGHYQTLQPNQAESEKEEYKQSQRLKKKSYLLVNLQNDNTINKLKKYSSIQNQSSIEFHQANKKTNLANRPKLDLDDLPSVYASSTINRERLPSEIGSYSQLQYRREITTIYLLLARLYVNIKSFESAANYYKTCLNFNPHKIEAILELASLYYTQKGYKICLQWLQTSIASFEKEKEYNDRWELDIGYLRYYRALILLQEGKTDESYRQLCELKVKQLSSEVNYYKGILMMRRLAKDIGQSERNKTIQSILMHFNQSIACYTSQEYLSKSFFQILVILLFEKKDYYGAQYELARFKKMMPTHCQVQQEPFNLLKKQIKICEDEEVIDPKESRLLSTQRENYFSILSDLTEAVICILKMKITKGLTIIKQIGLRLQGNNQDLLKCFGNYYNQLFKVVLQFKFYSYYILRQYQMSLKHVNKLLEVMAKEEYFCNDNDRKGVREVEIKLLNINRLMLECMILMKQTKFNYAMSKLKEIESMLIQGNGSTEQQAINSGLIVNNFNMVKSLCYINIYSQLEQEKRDSLPFGEWAQKEKSKGDSSDENNKEILLSAEQLLRHCLISDKENSLIYYLISIIHFELQSYESSLKYIREALQYSDDHMIKHYFAKANTKALMGRYDEAIKDYTNAVIVFKEQNKNEVVSVQDPKIKANKLKQQQMDEYYQEKQIMIKEIYLNRAIAYLKQAYALGKQSKFIENANLISSYRLKASEDLLKYFTALLDGKIDLSHQREIREKLLLFMHTDDPHQAIQLGKKFIPRLQLLNDQDYIGIYYLTKELNNCISHLKTVIRNLEEKTESKEIEKSKKDSLPAKYKKISMALPKNKVSNNKNVTQRLLRLKLDLRCLQALKRSSSRYQGALEQSLIQLLELTEQIYKQKEVLNSIHKDQQSTITLQELLTSLCGQIFRWSDILFFIGVIHYQLCEYETAIKYFEESYNEKRMSGTLYSLEKYLQPREQVSEQEEQERNQDLEPLFENCVYSKEEMNYNLGLCYLMLKKYKQAYYYLQSYPHFLEIIRKGITDQSNSNDDNQFISESEKPNHGEIFIDDGRSLQSRKSKRISKQIDPKQREFDYSIQDLKDDIDYQSNKQSRLSEESKYPNITPFPIRNRLCSIYTPRTVEKYSFNLSFCLPKIGLPTLSTFYEEQIEMGRVVVEEDDHSISQCSQVERLKDIEQDCNRYKLSRDSFESAVKHLSLLDLEMKPIAPWIRQNINGIIFTENLINESVELNSERADRLKEKAELKEGRKAKKDRYGSEECKE